MISFVFFLLYFAFDVGLSGEGRGCAQRKVRVGWEMGDVEMKVGRGEGGGVGGGGGDLFGDGFGE